MMDLGQSLKADKYLKVMRRFGVAGRWERRLP